MVQYVEIIDQKNPKKPNQMNIAIELQKWIEHVETKFKVEFKSACFLGKAEVKMKGETDTCRYAVMHDIAYQYMLFFG